MTTFTADHPAWTPDPDGYPVRAVRSGAELWQVRLADSTAQLRALSDTANNPPVITATDPGQLPTAHGAAPLVSKLATLGTVERMPNPSLWDAITTAVLRQVVRAAQARHNYERWCNLHGQALDTAATLPLAPGPDTVLDLPESAFAGARLTFYRRALQAAAAAYQQHGDTWCALRGEDLIKALTTIPRIGPWTAAAACADYTGDFSAYPHGDLAVRTWAHRAAPGLRLPSDEPAFVKQWRTWANHDSTQLHALTLFTLTWGTHVRTAQPDEAQHP